MPAARVLAARVLVARVLVARVLAALALAVSAICLVARMQPVTSLPRLVLAVGAVFAPAAAILGLGLAAVARRAVLAIIGGLLVAITVATQVLWFYGGGFHGGWFQSGAAPAGVRSVEVRVLSSNLRYGQADAAAFTRLAEQADIVFVAELTAQAVRLFGDAGIAETFPYSHLFPAPRSGGIGIWSRFPLTPVPVPAHDNVKMPAARVDVPGVERDPLVASVHVRSPLAGDENTLDDWRDGIAAAAGMLDDFARVTGGGAVIAGGDFNSTPDMRQFRDLLTNGYRDAVNQSGSGFAPTYPADTRLPPVICIDHVLTRNAVATSVRTVDVPGSDHRAVLATVRVPSEG